MHTPADTLTLCNGYAMPCLGFGTWQTPDGETAVTAVRTALEKGYRHIDTAAIYGNETSVGKGIAASGLAREKVFVTSKLWNSNRGYENTFRAFEKTLSDLRLDYLDLYLIHWPASASRFANWETINLETWRALTELYKAGRIRAIGVSNFLPHHLEALMQTEVPPMVNQIEYHPGHMQKEAVQYCRQHGILIEAWGPLGTGKILSNPLLAAIAGKYQKSVAQLCIRWCLQNQTLPLPKSVTPSRIEENADIFDFTLSREDMDTINNMPPFGSSGLHPDKVKF